MAMDGTPGEKMKVLIVDDEVDVCYLLSNILSKKNLQASFVNTLREAKEALGKESPSIVFLDNHLPDGIGINFIKEIKLNNPGTKIIMITAHDTVNDKVSAYSEGVDFFIGKPFTRDTIFGALDRLNW